LIVLAYEFYIVNFYVGDQMGIKKAYLEKSNHKIGYVEYEMRNSNLYIISTFLEERHKNVFIIRDICRKFYDILEDENPEYIVAKVDDRESFSKMLKNVIRDIEIYEKDGKTYMRMDCAQVKQKLKAFI